MEIAIVARAKQGHIYRYMVEHDMSVRELADAIKISYQTMISIINLRWIPPTRYRKKEDITDRLERFFKLPVEHLFPPELTKEVSKRISRPIVKILEVDTISLIGIDEKFLAYNPNLDDKIDVEKCLEKINKRERKVICQRFGIGTNGEATLEEIAEQEGVGRERIRQIEQRAIMKMRRELRRELR